MNNCNTTNEVILDMLLAFEPFQVSNCNLVRDIEPLENDFFLAQ